MSVKTDLIGPSWRCLLLALALEALLLVVAIVSVSSAAPREKPTKPIPITLIYVDGPDAVGVPMAEKMLDAAIKVINRVKGVRLVRGRTYWYADSFPMPTIDIEARFAQRNHYARLTCPQFGKKGSTVLTMTGTIGGGYFAGVADGTCTIGNRCSSAIVNVRYTGPISFAGAVTTIVHELGHVIGAQHTPIGFCSAMDPVATSCSFKSGKILNYAAQSAAEIGRCVAGKLGRRSA